MSLTAGSVLVVLWTFAAQATAADPSQRFVSLKQNQLVYDVTPQGDRIVDFSYCGFQAGRPLPSIDEVIEVSPAPDDNTTRLQCALDAAAEQAKASPGRVVAVQLAPGRYEVAGSLVLASSGVVLRGASATAQETKLVATGLERRAVIHIGQTVRQSPRAPADARRITAFAPAGTMSVTVDSPDGLKVGDRVRIDHQGTKEWIHALGMDRFPSRDLKGSWLDWRPGTVNLTWHRRIESVEEQRVTLDAPLPYALNSDLSPAALSLDERFSSATDAPCSLIGVENLAIESTFDPSNARDEDHAWDGIRMDRVEDAWVRNVTFRDLAGSAVAVWEHARRITVSDCESLSPISEHGGQRRHTFFTAGEQTLFLRCTSHSGRHDFSVGHLAAGPNAFVHCKAENAQAASGSIGSWACGILYDNVEVDGAGLALTNSETASQGTGWAAVNSVLWNCVASVVTCRMPPTGQNWAIGVWGEVVGDGHWRQLNEFASPSSLFQQQLGERLGSDLARQVLSPELARVHSPEKIALPTENEIVQSAAAPRRSRLGVHNGWLTFGDRLATGGRLDPVWWRGSILPTKAAEFGPCLTRFVPGQEGTGYTDRIPDLVRHMQGNNQVALGHHWGLWYDRRRDDHQMIRRIDGDVWPPFYEQPWARSGVGVAWDGLSKYDLAKFNPWYFGRLKSFADAADREGLVLIEQMYFQHNILEAGAHWADFPWRPANCLQETGFPEPPVYENRKRVFMADAFYDVTHAVRRDLHRAYIRHCLDVLGSSSNVIFLIGEEYTGPAHFMRFWLETIRDWQAEHSRDVIVGLSCAKDVQDEILADAGLSRVIDVIDLKYWWYTASGETYAPKGGENLAPRQQLREWWGNARRTDSEVARAIAEYRLRYPGKAVICSLPGTNPWVVAAAGGSLPALPATTNEDILRAIPNMHPGRDQDGKRVRFALAGDDGSAIELDTSDRPDGKIVSEGDRSIIAVHGRTGRLEVPPDETSKPSNPPASSSIRYRVRNW